MTVPPQHTLLPPTLSAEGRALVGTLRTVFASASYVPPVLPSVLVDLLELSRDPDADLKEIRAAFERDPLVTARVLRLAQSAVYGLASPVHTLDAALVRLGLRQLTMLCAEAATRLRVFRAPGYDDAMEALAKHSAACAHGARHLARRFALDAELAFLAGLLHDVGIAASFIVLADPAGRPISTAPALEHAWPAVREARAHSSGAVFRAWSLAPEIGAAARSHHDTSVTPPDRLTALVALANWTASEAGYPLFDEFETPSAGMLGALGLTEADLPRMLEDVRETLARAPID
jgi:HD-like signal output (HDOD) protein